MLENKRMPSINGVSGGELNDEVNVETNITAKAFKSAKNRLLCMAFAGMVCFTPVLGTVVLYSHTAYGFEGFMAYDINELSNGNPWSENDDIKTLPVFQNPTVYDRAGRPVVGLSADEMILKAKETASALGLTVDSVYTNPTEEILQKERERMRSVPGNESYEAVPYEAVAVCGDITIEAEINGAVLIIFEEGMPLPDEFSFTYRDTDEEQARHVMQYLLEHYKPIVAMESPAVDLFGDYNIYAQRSFSFDAYEYSSDLTDRILGYNFNRVSFSPNDEGELWIIDRYSADLSQKIGDYPIISEQKARELLLQKHYITTAPEELTDEKYIASVELIYRIGRYDEVFMPYYRYLVELPTLQRDNGLKCFGAFYVPAVRDEYLTDLPLWDGSFN